MNIKDQKKVLRQSMLAKRMQINADKKLVYDEAICNKLFELILNANYKVVHAYIPMANEINITVLLQKLLDQKILVVCPKTLPARELENRLLTSLQDLETGIKGTQHPAKPQIFDGNYDLIIVPGLAFDKQKYRLGYGGGYYDGFLGTQPQSHKVGILYPFQQVDEVPREAHDVCLDDFLVGEFEI
jgi:5-formyltetrahydrofolate cyclo-ligase